MNFGVGGYLYVLSFVLSRLGCALIFDGTADYLNNHDTMTLASDDADQTNSPLQTEYPFNPNSNNTHGRARGWLLRLGAFDRAIRLVGVQLLEEVLVFGRVLLKQLIELA